MPRKVTASKNTRKANGSQTKFKRSVALKRCFEETIQVLDSDDDFVIPNPSIRGLILGSGCNTPNSSMYAYDNNDINDDSFNLVQNPSKEQKHSNSNVIEIETSDEDDVKELKVVNSQVANNRNSLKFGCDNNNLVRNKNLHKFSSSSVSVSNCEQRKALQQESWKTLMLRMQDNQKTNKSLFSQTNLNTTGRKLHKKAKVNVKPTNKQRNILSTSYSTSTAFSLNQLVENPECSKNFIIHESPPKKAKLEMETTTTVKASTEISKSTLFGHVEEDPSMPSSTSTTSKNSTCKNSAPLTSNTNSHTSVMKVADIFLKPSERAAQNKIKIMEKSETQLDLCSALKSLSTEPNSFDSAQETPDKFDRNVVRLNVTVPSDAAQTYFNSKTKTCPFYKKLPGTRFAVDAFNYGLVPGIEIYFLSHFHSDHYIGLTNKFCKTLICSPPTANLVQMKLNVNDKCIRKLHLNREYVIDGIQVVLINANHCPGSVMFIFRLPSGTTYFHTGDFRFTSDMLDNHFLQGLRIDCLYLDTTYCDPQYDFPTQTNAIAELIQAVKRQLDQRPKTLIVCGSYVIGKERVYFSLAEVIGSKVFMNADKRRVINALENPIYNSYLTDKEDQASIHVMQMFSIVPKFLLEYLEKRNSRYNHIIGIKPSGWQFSSGSGSNVRSHFNNQVTIIGVPYSEHSSFSELETLVKATKPSKIQPTVNVGNTAKREKMMEYINKWLISNKSSQNA